MKKSVEERFWGKVNKNTESGCWEWTAYITAGYGYFYYEGKMERVHRVIWNMLNGPIPPNKVIMHRCDNPKCVNPDHLQMGTQRENMLDMIAKGRNPQTRPAFQRKLTYHTIVEIYKRADAGETISALAREYGVCRSVIRDIYTGRRHGKITQELRDAARTCKVSEFFSNSPVPA